VPAHAQRMSRLLASDKEFALCESKGGHMRCGVKGRGAMAVQAACARGEPDLRLWGPGHARRERT
jgi:hypothetical protein